MSENKKDELEVITNEGGQLAFIAGIDEQKKIAEQETPNNPFDEENNPKVIFNQAAASINMVFAFMPTDLEEMIEADPSFETAETAIKEAFRQHYKALEGQANDKGEPLTEQLDALISKHIKKKIDAMPAVKEALQLLEQNKSARQLSSIRMASDSVTKEVFNNAIKHGNKPVMISGKDDPVAVYVTVEQDEKDKLKAGDRIIFDTMASLKDAGYGIIDTQRIHNTMSNNGGYQELTENTREAINDRINIMRRIGIEIDITEASSRYEKLNELPITRVQDPTKGFQKRLVSSTKYLLPVERISIPSIGIKDAWYFIGEPLTYRFAEKITQMGIVNLHILSIPGKKTIMHWDICAYLLDRVRQANAPGMGANARIIKCEGIYEKAGMADGTRPQKQDCRNTTKKILDNFKKTGHIYDYKTSRHGRVIYSYDLIKAPDGFVKG